MKKLLIAALLTVALFTGNAHAEDNHATKKKAEEPEYSLSFGFYTKHYSGDQNESNRLIGFSYKNWTIAEFDNSYDDETVFLGYWWHTDRYSIKKSDWWVRANLYTGLLYGYKDNIPHVSVPLIGYVSPGIYPTASLGHKDVSMELGVMPSFFWMALKIEF